MKTKAAPETKWIVRFCLPAGFMLLGLGIFGDFTLAARAVRIGLGFLNLSVVTGLAMGHMMAED